MNINFVGGLCPLDRALSEANWGTGSPFGSAILYLEPQKKFFLPRRRVQTIYLLENNNKCQKDTIIILYLEPQKKIFLTTNKKGQKDTIIILYLEPQKNFFCHAGGFNQYIFLTTNKKCQKDTIIILFLEPQKIFLTTNKNVKKIKWRSLRDGFAKHSRGPTK